jgi:hypothetical protein
MHTALCSYRDEAEAAAARQRLLAAGYEADDIHLQHRDQHAQRHGIDPRAWDGMEREIAVDPRVVQSIGDFFGRLFGAGQPHGEPWSRDVHAGHWVLCVDAGDDARAGEALRLMHGGAPAPQDRPGVVHRPQQPRLRELARDLAQQAQAQAPGRGGAAGTAASARDGRGERATAAGTVERPNRDGWGRTRPD